MSSGIGQELKQAREALGLSFEEITERSMIPKKYLNALEKEQFSLFPGEVYAKGALRKYATILGLDAQGLITRYNNYKTGSKEAEESAEIFSQETAPVSEKQSVKQNVVDSGKIQKSTRLLLTILIILGLLTAAYFIFRQTMTADPQPNNPPINNAEDENRDPETGDENIEEEITEPEDEEPAPPPVTVTRDPNTDEVRFLVANADQLTAELVFTDACWIRIIADGNKVLSGTFRSNQNATAAEEMSIRLGNPPAISLKINGQEVQLPDTRYAYTLTIVRVEE
ncbi:MAG: DUF4115 domain-containing protein [Firmicutes bacterium]|nr:DUF4115 domain-containing protein [Bacillota bacterium]